MDFVSELNGDRVGLIPFAGTAFLMCPLTMDYDAFRQSLTALDTNTIPQGGTDLASAIYEAHAAFTNERESQDTHSHDRWRGSGRQRAERRHRKA